MPALIIDPALVAAVTRQFNLRGELQPFNLTENVVPIFDIGKLVGQVPQEVVTPGLVSSVRIGVPSTNTALQTSNPQFAAAEITSATVVAPIAGSVLVDSGPLAAGTWWIQTVGSHDDALPIIMELQHRDAANLVTLSSWRVVVVTSHTLWFTQGINLNERFRWVNVGAIAGNGVAQIAAGQATAALSV